MSPDEIASHVAALRKKLDEPHKNLYSEIGEHWPVIRRFSPVETGQPNFNLTNEMSGAIGNVGKDDVVKVYRDLIVGANSRKLTSHVYGNKFTLANSGPKPSSVGNNMKMFTVEEIRKSGNQLPLHSETTTNGSFNRKGGLFCKRNKIGLGIALGLGVVGLGVYMNRKPTGKKN